ncbi:hypothetical protein MHC_04870 [Mycoplasma haemocanis str. Illinois]|uniref:Uncharacterized protein n=1 Tax=Mycoplasma haemocanis (strain Illinois) TaxID=1111676 RepID=H6N858_MYCHN|nr:hypothetical protein [Mycoplasma haemocanis]AEW45830.1 hypothetical protein MHC_04870 [Mycoplasma haemocanis str. Illinois]
MTLSTVKVVAGVGAVSGTAGLGYLVSIHLSSSVENKIAISKLFEQEGRTILSKDSDEEQWKERWKAYVESGIDSWKIADYEKSKSNKETVPSSFKDKCMFNFQFKVSGIDDPLYQEVINNCSKKFKVSELVGSNSKITTLNTDTGQDAEWKSAWQNYLDDNGDNNPLALSDWSSAKGRRDQLSNDFKNKCKAKVGEQVFGEKDPSFSSFVRWCAKVSS